MGCKIVVFAGQLTQMIGKEHIRGEKLIESGHVRSEHRGSEPIFNQRDLLLRWILHGPPGGLSWA
jgi:hypothetical protein